MSNWKKFAVVFVIVSVAAALYGYYLYQKKPTDIRSTAADIHIGAEQLAAAFAADENSASLNYIDKIIAVTGVVSSVVTDSLGPVTVFLETGDPISAVSCSFYDEEAASAKAIKKGNRITIKGQCTGKLSDVILNKCSIQH